ncbi:MAG: hypothetical protein B7Y56_13355 [Gallionellales bacterium 35-53-114]|jgi:hypothetical protein|nr:MAG: hypothetical protein B7Y56_13355 [Gallionellales bacterium 35-53-114]OYZ63077.1 MAG: hypothetical protein B7Y04_11460 [Gallionellales bacterium 24-53-125]OZB08942.1 MAG: hypothetical protein B7X61_08140 [Gallionellales bacterium 39-52-133]HQS59385.1 hypothetical protein [Gallionellaceae bacterium]HQS76298.1 hypothetical protein [Gallionellaceae bacterium]
MQNNFTAIATLLVGFMSPTITYSATPIEIGQTNGVFDGASCSYYSAIDKKPKLIKEIIDKGPDAIFKYEHTPGRPVLYLGSTRTDQEWKQVAAININGKELLLDFVKQEPSLCLDEVHQKQVECTTNEYANHEYKIFVKRLTSQRACFPDSAYCAGDAASVLVTIEGNHSQKSLLLVGGCAE